MTTHPTYRSPLQCLGIGVGPSNLSLASLLDGHDDIRAVFVERKPSFGWHDGMLLRGLHLQVSLFKDLVTLADPRNRFSFLSYLHSEGKMYHYINAQFDAVPLPEFANYLNWASRNNKSITFGEEVLGVEFDGENFQVTTSHRRMVAENLSIGVGTRPHVPEIASEHLGDTNFHVSDSAYHPGFQAGKRVTVVGGGQSGAEAVLHLLTRPATEAPVAVTWISRRSNFLPMDDSPFTNDQFTPSYSDHFFRLRHEVRHDIVDRNVLTSDGISDRTLRDIYQAVYRNRFIDRPTPVVSLRPGRTVTGFGREADGWTLTGVHHDSGTHEVHGCDVVVWATGLRPGPTDFLAPIEHRIEHEGDELRIDEGFAVVWDGPPDRRIFRLNGARRQRGLADPNLSLLAWRSQCVIDRIRGVCRTDTLEPSFVSWAPVLEQG